RDYKVRQTASPPNRYPAGRNAAPRWASSRGSGIGIQPQTQAPAPLVPRALRRPWRQLPGYYGFDGFAPTKSGDEPFNIHSAPLHINRPGDQCRASVGGSPSSPIAILSGASPVASIASAAASVFASPSVPIFASPADPIFASTADSIFASLA